MIYSLPYFVEIEPRFVRDLLHKVSFLSATVKDDSFCRFDSKILSDHKLFSIKSIDW